MVNGAATPLQPVTTAAADAVRAQVRRIAASPQFASAGKLHRFLEFIVEETLAHPDIPPKEYSIGVSVYCRPVEYDPRTDSIVRVEAGKLRARLAQYYEGRGRDDPVRISVPKGAYVPAFEFCAPPQRMFSSIRQRTRVRPMWAVLAGAALLLTLGAWELRILSNRQPPAHFSSVQRISHERRFALDPAPSPDGKSIAYASDEAHSPYLNLWVHDVATGKARRLTQHAANDSAPCFSADGRWVVFRSDEDGGGIYMAPAAGGRPVLLVPRGRDPRFAPSGLLLAYWVAGDEETADFGKAFLLDVARSRGPYPKPDPLFNGFAHVRSPVWSGDGRSLLAFGTLQSDVPEKEYDAWTIRTANGHPAGPAIKTGLVSLLRDRGFIKTLADRNGIRAAAWSEGLLYIAVPDHDKSTLVRVGLSSKGKLKGDIEAVLPGTERFSAPWNLNEGVLAFASGRIRYDVWSVPAQPGAAASPVTNAGGTNVAPSVSRDGTVVVWQAILHNQTRAIRALDVRTQRELELAHGPTDRPAISPDGRRAAWRVMDGTRQAIDSVLLSAPAQIERLCADCGTPVSWTPDGTRILFETGAPNTAIDALEVATHKRSPVLVHPSHSLYGARFHSDAQSPSNGWLVFYAATGSNTRQIFVTEFRDYRANPEARWIPITDGRSWDVEPCWSENGDLIYFISHRASMRGIWAQHVDAATKQPVGTPFLMYRPSSASQTLLSTLTTRRATGLTAAAGRLFFAMDESESSVWLLRCKPEWD